jgi:hypothetical protein
MIAAIRVIDRDTPGVVRPDDNHSCSRPYDAHTTVDPNAPDGLAVKKDWLKLVNGHLAA